MKKYLFFILFFVTVCVNAQAPQKFYTRFGGYGHDIGYAVLQTLNGQYAVTGSTGSFGNGNSDVYLAFVDSMGWVRWEKSYGGFNNDIGKSIIQLADSGFVIAGYTNSFGAGGYDMLVVRTDKVGNLIWQKTYGGLDWDFAYAVKTTAGGDSLIIGGSTYSFGYGKMDAYIVKTDLNGNFQWQKTYGGSEDDEFKSFVLTYNNQYAFAGTTKSMGDVKGDCWLVKTGLAGDSVLSIKYGNNNKQFLNDIKENPVSKNFYLCGGHDQVGLDSTSVYLLGLSETGTFLFEDFFTYHKLADEQYVALAHFKNNDFVYVRKNAYHASGNRKLEPMVLLFNNNNYVNASAYGSVEDDELFAVAKTRDKGFVFVGYTKGFLSNLSDVYLIKVDSLNLSGASSAIGINESVSKTNINHKVYPTLTSSIVNIEIEGDYKNSTILISNSFGQLLSETAIKTDKIQLSLEGLHSGIYFITIRNSSRIGTFKIIKTE
ncbi:MAG: T9SS type A sorting domain-containing protein [Bacteroidia bacterium]|nr:T9SS type A sorting domain-containing protein [Bacteroidia bacterium]